MFRKFEKRKFNVVGNVIKDNYERYVPSIFDEFLIGDTRKSDIYFLLNQKRIDKQLSSSVVESYFDRLNKLQPESIFQQLTDEQRFDIIKSRRISSFSDLYTYSKNLTQEAKHLSKEIDDDMKYELYKRQLTDDYNKYKSNQNKSKE